MAFGCQWIGWVGGMELEGLRDDSSPFLNMKHILDISTKVFILAVFLYNYIPRVLVSFVLCQSPGLFGSEIVMAFCI